MNPKGGRPPKQRRCPLIEMQLRAESAYSSYIHSSLLLKIPKLSLSLLPELSAPNSEDDVVSAWQVKMAEATDS